MFFFFFLFSKHVLLGICGFPNREGKIERKSITDEYLERKRLANLPERNGRVDGQIGDVTSFGVGPRTKYLLHIYHYCGMTCNIQEIC